MTSLPARVAELSGAVEQALAAHLDRALPRLPALHGALAPLADELRAYVLGGGKRLRPVLVLLGHEIAGGRADDVLGPAVAVELLHTCALLHDDVIDAADTRRGRPATHVAFAAAHRDAGWSGDPVAYGQAIAILLGDLAFVQADEAFLSAAVPPAALVAGQRAFVRLREEVMAGQVLDVRAAASRSTDRDLAVAVATLKSGRYSVTRPLQLGATLAGADPALLGRLEAVGEPLGVAFQLRDDLLGVLGDAGETGKPVAGDLAEGKRTLLIAEAAARLDPADWAVVDAALGDPDLDAARTAEVIAHLTACGAVAAVEARITADVAAARAALADLPDGPATTALSQLTTWFATRTA